MNRNRKLSESTYGKRHVQPHMMPDYRATKKKRRKAGKKYGKH